MFNALKPKEIESDANLIPIMNLFVAMIPFLLMSASFFSLSIINASVPTVANDDTVIEIQRQSVNMTLLLRENGLKISGGSEHLSEAQMAKLNFWLPMKKGKYNFKGLSSILAKVKELYPRSKNLVIIPHDEASYELIVDAMDASREYRGKKTEETVELFPNVVVSNMI